MKSRYGNVIRITPTLDFWIKSLNESLIFKMNSEKVIRIMIKCDSNHINQITKTKFLRFT